MNSWPLGWKSTAAGRHGAAGGEARRRASLSGHHDGGGAGSRHRPPGRTRWLNSTAFHRLATYRCTRAPWSATPPAASWPSPWLHPAPAGQQRSATARHRGAGAWAGAGGARLKPALNWGAVARCRAPAPQRWCRRVWQRCLQCWGAAEGGKRLQAHAGPNAHDGKARMTGGSSPLAAQSLPARDSFSPVLCSDQREKA